MQQWGSGRKKAPIRATTRTLARANSSRPLIAHNGGITDPEDHSSQDGRIKHADLTMSKGKRSKNRGSDAAVGIRPQEGADQSNDKQLVFINTFIASPFQQRLMFASYGIARRTAVHATRANAAWKFVCSEEAPAACAQLVGLLRLLASVSRKPTASGVLQMHLKVVGVCTLQYSVAVRSP